MIAESEEPKPFYIPPFENPIMHIGHASIIDEIKSEFEVRGKTEPPAAIVVAVGGGGLLCGILKGLERNGWGSVPVVAAETEGASSFALGLQQNEPTALPDGCNSIAKSLCVVKCSPTAIQLSKAHAGGVVPVQISDANAVDACCKFADDQRCIVEPACGTALAAGSYDTACVANGLSRVID